MNSKKHKLSRRILAMLLAICMFVTMFPSAMFAELGDGNTGDSGQETTSVTSTANGVTVNKYVTGDAQNGYKLTMEAYASENLETTTNAEPLDIVLVLDMSGSMEDGFIEDSTTYEEVDSSQLDTSKTYYVNTGLGYSRVEHDGIGWHLDFPILGSFVRFDPDETQFYERHFTEAVAKIDALKSAVNTFIGEVANNASDNEVNHRISIVKFAGKIRNSEGNDWYNEGWQAYNYSQVVEELTNVNGSGAQTLKNAVNELQPAGATRADYGMQLAAEELSSSSNDKVVVMFTDGTPTSNNTFDSSVANDAVTAAKELKDSGASIYTVGVFNGANPDADINNTSDENKYMQAVSSNYPQALSYTNLGTRGEGNYYFAAEDADGLTGAFEDIWEDVTTGQLAVYPDDTAVLSDTLTDQFKFPFEFTSKEQYQAKYVPAKVENGEVTFDETRAKDVNVQLTVNGKGLEITGFDYHEKVVSYDKQNNDISGGKLVVTFPIEVDTTACLTNSSFESGWYDTNVSESAGLAYKVTEQDESNTQFTMLNDSPQIYIDKSGLSMNGTDVTVQIYVDGTPVTGEALTELLENVDDALTISRVTGEGDNFDAFRLVNTNEETGILTYDFNFNEDPQSGHNCVDIGVSVPDQYVLQGVKYNQSVGSGEPKPVTDKDGTYTIDNLASDQNSQTADCTIYLYTKYSVDYYLNGAADKNKVDGEHNVTNDTATYIIGKSVNRTTDPFKGETGSGMVDWMNPDVYETTIKLSGLPSIDGSTVTGWWTDSAMTGDPSYVPTTTSTVEVSAVVGSAVNRVINFYAKSTANPKNLESITKEVVMDTEDNANLIEELNKKGTFVYPDEDANGEPILTVNEGDNATLVYKITVTGDPETSFTVTDKDENTEAALVKTDDEITEENGTFSGTIPDDREAVFYVSYNHGEMSVGQNNLSNTAIVSNTSGGDKPDPSEDTEEVPVDVVPDGPAYNELKKLIKVNINCTTIDNHKLENLELKENSAGQEDSYSVTVEKQPDGTYLATVTVKDGLYVDELEEMYPKGHDLTDDSQDDTVVLKYNTTTNAWEIRDKDPVNTDTDGTVIFTVFCEYDLTGITKTLVTNGDEKTAADAGVDVSGDKYLFPENTTDKITIPYDGSVTLLYKITVSGKASAGFAVTDDGAVLVESNVTKAETVITGTDDYAGKIVGTIPEGANSVTFYVEKTFGKNGSELEAVDGKDGLYLVNTVDLAGKDDETVNPEDPTEDDTVIVPGEEGVQTFKLTYDGNAIDGATVENVPDGSDGHKNGDKVGISDQIPTYNEDNVVFIGWSTKQTSIIYGAGENYGEVVTDSVTFADKDITLYAVWGYDTNGDNIADAKQVFITPADITAYTGGQDYSGVVDADGNIIEDLETNAGLPEPGYFITLPYDAQQWVHEQEDGNATAADLSKYLTFTYSGSVEGQTGDTTREWGLVSQGNYDATRYVYSLTAGVVDGDESNTIPVRLSYFTDSNGDGKPSSDEILDENIVMTEDSVYNTFSMTINSGGLNQGEIKATFNASTETPVTDGPEYSVAAGTGTLTVKSVVNQDTTNTNAIVSDASSVDTNVQTAVAGEGVTYLVNDSEVQVPVANDRVQLLVDSVSNNKDFNDQMGQDAIATVGGNTDTHEYELVYMDLVDTQNGNVEVTLGDDDSLTIYWPMPEDADENGTFQVVHYTDMDREETVDNLSGVETETLTVTKTRINGQVYLTFSVDSFSPFALVYETDNGGNQGGGGWTPDGGDDGPDGLNTEDHFSYIVGYAEDYRTGEPTDNEDLWPVKPNNQITRAEVATIFYRLLEDEVRDEYDTTVNDFSDVSADSWYNQTVSTLASMEIVKGYEDGTFRPNAPITRAEFGAIATRFFAETGATYVPGTFTDVTGDEWYANAIQDAVNLGLIGGYPDGTVRPNNNITRAEACAIVNRTLGRVPDADHLLPEDVMKVWPDNNPTDWFYADMQEATNGHEYSWITEDGNEVEEWISIMLDNDWTDR